MGNSGKNSNTSQFFVTLGGAPKCDGRHVVFGEVVSGMEVASAIEFVASADGGEPSVPVAVADCGAYAPLVTPGAGSWYDRPDPESYAGVARAAARGGGGADLAGVRAVREGTWRTRVDDGVRDGRSGGRRRGRQRSGRAIRVEAIGAVSSGCYRRRFGLREFTRPDGYPFVLE